MAKQNPNKHRQNENIVENRELSIWEALIPVFVLVCMLAYNVYVFGDDALSGSNQFILLLGGAVAAIVGFLNKVSYKQMLAEVAERPIARPVPSAARAEHGFAQTAVAIWPSCLWLIP